MYVNLNFENQEVVQLKSKNHDLKFRIEHIYFQMSNIDSYLIILYFRMIR